MLYTSLAKMPTTLSKKKLETDKVLVTTIRMNCTKSEK